HSQNFVKVMHCMRSVRMFASIRDERLQFGTCYENLASKKNEYPSDALDCADARRNSSGHLDCRRPLGAGEWLRAVRRGDLFYEYSTRWSLDDVSGFSL